jgi:hypothetical protein
MNADELSTITAEPIQRLGMSFYFDPPTGERAKELGLNIYEFYGLGRAGTLGDVDAKAVFDAFNFFNQATIDFLWTKAKTKADPTAVAQAYLDAAYAFADRTFGAVSLTVLSNFAAAARKIIDAEPRGTCPLVDGYKKFSAPANPVHAAYLGAIFLRELRGGLHIHAVNEVGLAPEDACFLQDPAIFTLHGYRENEAPQVTEELKAKKIKAEELTSAAMMKRFDVLSDAERASLAEGTRQMFKALDDPVAVAG